MPSIDERVVAMAFENAKFEQGVAVTMRTLSKLDVAIQQVGQKNSFGDIEKAASKVSLQAPLSALDKLKSRLFGAGEGAAQGMSDIEKAGNKVTLEQPVRALDKVQSETAQVGTFAAQGFGEIEKAGNGLDLGGMSRALSSLGGQFTAMEAVALGAFANIGAKLSEIASRISKSFSIEPVKAGFENYETQINAVQTILANTGLKGQKGLGKVSAALNELNDYANKTVYNFSEMAKNIGTFTAAGVDLKTATGSIKGIANLAAMSGSNSQQASTAMYQLSQAISAGRVGLQDWNSVVNAGMGGTVFQRALAQTAVAMGTLKDSSLKLVGPMKNVKVNGESFRNSIQAKPGQTSWLTSKVLTTALQNFTGDMSQAQLVAEGFTKAQAKAITSQAKVAVDAATKIKTFSQLMQALKEEVASSWAQVWKTLFGDINQAKSLFSPLHIAVENFLRGPIDGFNKRLKEWAKLGGRTLFITALKNAFEDLGKILHTIHMAFQEVFPPKTGKDMLATTKHFSDFIDKLKPSKELLDGLKRTFAGFFAVIHIGWSIIKGVVGVFANLLGVVGKGAPGFLGFTGSIGDMLVAFDKALTKGGLLKAFFSTLTNILRAPLNILRTLGSAFAGLFSDNHTKKIGQAGDAAKSFGDKLQPLKDIFAKIKTAIEKVIHVVNKLFEPFTKVVSSIGKAIANIGQTIGDALSGLNLDTVFHGISAAAIGGIFLAIKKFAGEGSLVVVKPLEQVGKALGGLTGVLKQMQQALKAGIILAIAAAILALAIGVKLLASINPEALTRAMTGVAIGLGELVGAIGILQGMAKTGGGLSLAATAGAMIALAGAVVILAGAMKIFATMSWDQMEKGLVGVGGALTAVGLGMKMIGPSITLAAPGILGVAVAMNVLAVAMKIFGSMSFGQIAQGILAISSALFVIGSGLEAMGPELILIGPGLIAVGFGLSVIAGAVAVFGRMNLKVLIQGILGVGAALGVIGVALWAMPPGPMLIAQAAGLLVAGLALAGIGEAIKVMGSMSLEQMAKGLVVLGAALFELAVGLDIMATTIPGAAALLLAATALAVLTPVISILGTLDIGTLAKGLGVIAAALLVLGVVGGVASPGIAALGIALSALGLAVILIGAGVYLIVKALIMLGDASVKSTGIVIAAITAFVVAIPKMIIDFLKGLVDIVAAVAALGPKIVDSLTKIFESLLQVVINAAPKIKAAHKGVGSPDERGRSSKLSGLDPRRLGAAQ
jgi:tape measure domain-containing protein